MKNLEKVFYMLSGIALVFIGIVIGQFLDSDAVAQKLGKPLEDVRTDYGVVQTTIFPLLIKRDLNEASKSGWTFVQAVPKIVDGATENYILIFKK